MPSVNLNEMDLRAFLTAFNAIAEISGYDFDAETEYRLAIANLVGELKSQLPPATRQTITVIPRVSLATVLQSKYAAWDAACAGGAVCQSADSLIVEYLDKYRYEGQSFVPGAGAPEAIGQLRALVTANSADGWYRYELALCSGLQDNIDSLQLSDMLEELCRLSKESR